MNRYPIPLARAAILTGLVALAVIGPVGCGPAKSRQTKSEHQKSATDPWAKLKAGFVVDTDAAACRQMLADLNGGLAANVEADRPRRPKPGEVEAVAKALRLTDAETKFLNAPEYGSLDGLYLAECLYLEDVARSLGLDPDESVRGRGRVAFDWVCRQMVLQPWLIQVPEGVQAQPPLPPVYALRRGWGSGLERAITFLALCRQLDLDACLVGTAVADQSWSYSWASESKGYPEGPFWAVGVRDGDDLVLFDPFRGEQFPGKGTLAEIKANPAVLEPWRKDAQNKWPVTDEQVKGAEVYLTAPLSALAPRMDTLDQRLRAETSARIWLDWKAVTDRLAKAAGVTTVKGWNPPNDVFTPVRVLDTFLPPEQGGGTFGIGNPTLYPQYQGSFVQFAKQFTLPPELTAPDVRQRLIVMAINAYGAAFQPQFGNQGQVQWPPREKVQRGRHVEATRELMQLRDRYKEAESRRMAAATSKVNAEVIAWITETQRLSEQLSRAKVSEDKGIQVPLAVKQLDEHWVRTQPVQGVLLVDLIARPGAAEATYLLALSFHERAERSQVDADRVARTKPNDQTAVGAARKQAAADWKSAAEWWGRYEEYRAVQNESYPGRAELTKKLAERAEKLKSGG